VIARDVPRIALRNDSSSDDDEEEKEGNITMMTLRDLFVRRLVGGFTANDRLRRGELED
jgi:hypothetical protein